MRTEDILTVITPERVEVTFVAYPYRPLRPPIQTPFLPFFHLDDLDIVETMFINDAYTPDQIKSFLDRNVRERLKKALSI